MSIKKLGWIILVLSLVVTIAFVVLQNKISEIWSVTTGKVVKVTCGNEYATTSCKSRASVHSKYNYHTQTVTYCVPNFFKECDITYAYEVNKDTYTGTHFQRFIRSAYPQVDDLKRVYFNNTSPEMCRLTNPAMTSNIVGSVAGVICGILMIMM